MTPRDYQSAAIAGIRREFDRVDSTLVNIPTGLGKTVIFSLLAAGWDRGRVLVLAPTDELIEQARQKLYRVTGEMPDIEKAERFANESAWGRQQFVVASKPSLTRSYRDRWRVMQKRYSRISNVGLVIVDEAHLSVTKQYKEILDHYRKLGANVLGVTATPHRRDKKALGQIYESVAYSMSISDAIGNGWLVSPTTHCLQLTSLDLSAIDSGGADFNKKKLAKAMEADKVVHEIAELTAAESRGLKTVVYCSSIDHARKVAVLLAEHHGYKADWVCGDVRVCSKEKRKEALSSFANDPAGLEVLCNVGVLTTGWDCPRLNHIVMARPTKSLALYTQILGRGTRPFPDGVVDFEGSDADARREAIANSPKPFFKVTDLRDNSLEHKLISCVDVLGGEMGLDDDAKQIAREMIAESGEAKSLEEILAEAKARREAAEREERERLKRQKASATYARVAVNVFDGNQAGNVAPHGDRDGKRIKWGKHKGKLFSELPIGYLRFFANSGGAKPFMRNQCLGELSRRAAIARRQAKGGAPGDTSEASRVAERLRAILAEI